MRKTLASIVAVAAVGAGLSFASPASAAAPGIEIDKVQYNPPGNDAPVTNAKLGQEWVLLRNNTKAAINMTGWTLRDKESHVYKFGTFSLGKGKTIYVRTATAANSVTSLYWNVNYYIWNNNGDTATLRNSVGTKVDSCTWTSGGQLSNC